MRILMSITSKENKLMIESMQHSYIFKPRTSGTVKNLRNIVNQYIEQLMAMKRQYLEENNTITSLRCNIREM